MRKILIIILVLVAVLTAIFFKDISNYFQNNSEEPTSKATTDQITDGVVISFKVKPNVDINDKPQPIRPEDMMNTQIVLGQRLNSYVNINAQINILDNNFIEVLLPNIDLNRGKEIAKRLTTSARLTIHAAHPLYNNGRHLEAHALAKEVADGNEIVPTYRAYPEMQRTENGSYLRDEKGNYVVNRYYLIKRRVSVSGSDIEFAQPSISQPGTTEITLTEKGGKDMYDFSTNLNRGDLIITLLDGIVISAASLNAPSLGKRFVITGQENKQESAQLAMALSAPLRNNIEIRQITEYADSKIVEEK